MDSTNKKDQQTLNMDPSTSQDVLTKADCENLDMKQKLFVTYNILQACIMEKEAKDYFSKEVQLNRLIFLTSLPRPQMLLLLNEIKKFIPASDVLKENVINTTIIELSIRRALVNFYVKLHEIPTITSMKSMMNISSDDHMHQILKGCGYIWKRLPNTKKSIIIEHPKQTLQRQRYFQQLNHYRQQNRPIVYVEVNVVTKTTRTGTNENVSPSSSAPTAYSLKIIVASRNGYITGRTFPCGSVLRWQELIEKYIVTNVLYLLREPTVIVMEDKPYYQKSLPVPSTESEKKEMMKWLDIHNVPYDANSHRSELFQLIRKCRNRVDLNKFDAILHSHGHNVVRRPTRTDYLNFFNVVNIIGDDIGDIMKADVNTSPEYWKALEKKLIEQEKDVYAEDLAMENIIDRILTMAETTDIKAWAELECDEMEENLAHEKYFINY